MCYIALEGIDGCGKSTIHKLLRKEFRDADFIREPGTSKFAEEIRRVIFENMKDLKPITVQLAMLAARSDLNITNPFTISDRCFLSGCYDEELRTYDKIKTWLQFTMEYVNLPDTIIFLDISPETSINRLRNRSDKNDYDTNDMVEIQKRIDAYHYWIKIVEQLMPNIKVIIVDANRSMQEVLNEVIAIIEEKLSCKKPEI